MAEKKESHPAESSRRYNDFAPYLKKTFGAKVQKIPLDLGFPCPNKDGTISTAGCIFCDEYGSGPIQAAGLRLDEQLRRGMERGRKKHRAEKFIAYFQANTGTAAPLPDLRRAVETVMVHPEVVGVAIGTRPDCLPPAHLDYLAALARRTHLWVELGLQSIHAASLRFLQRHHTLADFAAAFAALHERGIRVCVHVIIGIPSEGDGEVAQTARYLSYIGVDDVKIHPLHVLKRTRLEELYNKNEFTPLALDEYVHQAVIFIENLSAAIVVQRLTGEREREIFVAPDWALQKSAVLRRIHDLLASRNSFQGCALTGD